MPADAWRYLHMKNTLKRIRTLQIIILFTALLIFSGCTRSLTIYKGYHVENYQISFFTFDVWSYGNWKTSKTKSLWTHSFEPPYKLLLAIRSKEAGWSKIEMLSAKIIHGGTELDIMPTLSTNIEIIEKRDAAAIKEPYAVFHFKDAIQFNESFVLECEFKAIGLNGQVYKQRIEIPYSENRQKGFVFWDNAMGV
jgi:hypothetical protein